MTEAPARTAATPASRVEPAARLPLRWGRYDDRRAIGLLLIVGGLLHLQSSDTGNLIPLITGSAAHIAGWLIMPAAGWRRVLPLAPSTLVVWLLLTGPSSMWTLTIPFLFWLLVRHRPWRSVLAVGPVLLNGVVCAALFAEYRWMPVALALSAAVVVGSAWGARALARPVASIRRPARGAAATDTPTASA
ncbi:hypothetical protein GCM10009792_03700 [Microcella alkalica]|uniref:Uncharacterized protein n=1 Tax=Microcella alkalica TaxID=355930 RepID=A0A839E8X9_9MICO|nr:hypothetical protein [Microcella alkalica]MBA8849021.1 hypothetical protein [Microcella alkalica]